jgi:pyridoxamine 5'-phosphate oxidase
MSDREDLSDLRREFANGELRPETMSADPFEEFAQWFEQAKARIQLDPNAMTLATVDADGRPAARTVLLKYFDRSGFVFFTNYESRKARHIARNNNVALLFWWPELERQVEIDGTAERVSKAESARYFASRPRGSQLGAWVSQQSRVITSRKLLQMKLEELKRKFEDREVPFPSFWGGFRVVPRSIEFWQGRPSRLHDRICYVRDTEADGGWRVERLSP